MPFRGGHRRKKKKEFQIQILAGHKLFDIKNTSAQRHAGVAEESARVTFAAGVSCCGSAPRTWCLRQSPRGRPGAGRGGVLRRWDF